LTGTSLEDLKADAGAGTKLRVIAHALAFVAGFTVIFVAIGLSASAIGGIFVNNKRIVEIAGGVIIVVLGLNMMGILKIPALMMDKRVRITSRKPSYWVSFLVGLGFAAGWSPCIGPILSGIIVLAASERTLGQATFLLFVYSGAILVVTGIIVATDQFTRVAGFFYQYVKPPSL
jgi:cytochrome c-type biogenesis protein